MKPRNTTSLKTFEPLAMVRKHPMAASVGGLCTAIVCGMMGTLAEGGLVGAVMAAVGAIIGAPGAAHIAEDAHQGRPV